ncbi:uncharacterized protein LOC118375183 isoform X1 [Oncorhynchus keta]|uniref:uncharacterized protein LOC118375183 isoform X1 n=2 Tax=Oncorhynchus keta TaxID=8018 RepID=UPI0015FB452D|nr:uncharacterized protein LOC118375183 isoform X1 [Oncorhynchus keta]
MKRGIVRREEAKHERNQTVMPLHKTSHKAPRLDPTMISAPLGDFRHTMHIGRGGDAFGDTSFLATVGPSSDPGSPGATATNDSMAPVDSETPLNHTDDVTDGFGSTLNSELQHSESVSSFTLDMDFDLGPSIMGDVLGVMDGLGLDSDWTRTRANEEDVFSPSKSLVVEVENFKMVAEDQSVSIRNELNEKKLLGIEGDEVGDGRIIEGTGGIKTKGQRPKVRFSDKREEIIRQASEEEGQGLDVEEECVSPTEEDRERGNNIISVSIAGIEVQPTNHTVDSPSSSASSHSSEYEGVTPLDRRRVDNCHSETDSEEGGDNGRGYTFEDEFDDEIGL